MVHSGGYNMVIHHHLPVPPVVSRWESVSINMPSLWDCHYKRPEGPKYISPRCQPWVGSETSKVPEAQDDFMEERALASGMETDVRELVSITKLSLISNIHSQGQPIF
jgi:hypothetical protein